MILYNIDTLKLESELDVDNNKVVAYVNINKKIRHMRCHEPLISQYMESRRYKGKGLRRNE